jgi:hypothetical protein
MKKVFILSFIFCWAKLCFAQQNLVPNSGFENYVQCQGDNNTGFAHLYISNWFEVNGTPDYFNINCPIDTLNPNLPVTHIWGFQNPNSGNAFVGMVTYQLSTLQPSQGWIREYISCRLIEPLKIDYQYLFKMHVNLANNSTVGSCNLQPAFVHDSIPYDGSYDWLNLVPKLSCNNVVLDTVGWTEISGSFIADGTERYLVLGNFFSNFNTDTAFLNFDTPAFPAFTYSRASYYFIDDVSLVEDTSYHVGIKDLFENLDSFKLFPNPTSDVVNLEYKLEEGEIGKLEISNSLGQRLSLEEGIKGNGRKTLSLVNYSEGIYLVCFSVNGKIVEHWKLSVQK